MGMYFTTARMKCEFHNIEKHFDQGFIPATLATTFVNALIWLNLLTSKLIHVAQPAHHTRYISSDRFPLQPLAISFGADAPKYDLRNQFLQQTPVHLTFPLA